ncbi:Holliday junction branch migration protein RuvA [Wenzhouxiangella marina]|uniref:Holliday junction branch migration complex subunit RuvA n=1 Tax=Wenzhouxiangella marina TaxID=1579979 RepID=A0A0K0XTB0_9GAMM|nr:Holliday junction branch migration protein RuvA [Wenzhouxiangella marina]AKS40895.1 Holliday junction DNA helicase RuvA [Wenzhouxiangella marina]MBB6087769.1 Holliday junction DNA helicase RuvA [Wenzhouxiangella marina]
MIARLKGIVIERQPPQAVIDVAGVAYEVECPLGVFDQLPAVGQEATLLTQLIVREDAHTLYGFLRRADRALFRELLKVSGVGPRLALAILSGVSADDFALMVEAGDAQALTRLPGIGKKTAERLILEMRGRLPERDEGEGAAAPTDAAAEARAALTALGYSAAEALKMVRAVAEPDQSAEQLIRAALKHKMSG